MNSGKRVAILLRVTISALLLPSAALPELLAQNSPANKPYGEVKTVLREGTLQNKTGPSIATEFGVLLPNSRGDSGLGASLAGIVSQRWDWGAIHLNGVASLTREHHGDLEPESPFPEVGQ